MNINLGLFPELSMKGKKERAQFHRDRAIAAMKEFADTL